MRETNQEIIAVIQLREDSTRPGVMERSGREDGFGFYMESTERICGWISAEVRKCFLGFWMAAE